VLVGRHCVKGCHTQMVSLVSLGLVRCIPEPLSARLNAENLRTTIRTSG
jgi:hypothetical protein